jgi:hypothetical protein
MANLIKPLNIVTKTNQGEITINLNLSITLEQDGKISVNAVNQKEQRPDFNFEMPDIEIGQVVEIKKDKK